MATHSQATWGGRFSTGPADLMLAFSESVSIDRRLASFDIQVNKAHSSMLCHVGLINEEERNAIHSGLDGISRQIELGKFKWQARFEDVHMNIEQALTAKVPAAAKIQTARSRNDQVATDVRLFFKSACASQIERLEILLRTLVELSEEFSTVYIPGYTHLQRAQPVSMAHHLLAYMEMLSRDVGRFEVVLENANVCPLGSGALAGSTLSIDREFVARELGFVDAKGKPRLTQNSMDAVADRDLFVEFASACSLCGIHLSRIAEDMILWCSQEFKFIELPDAFCTGSSLMPQKKNPDSLELIRGKSGRLQGNLQALNTMIKGLPLTYNRDLQEDKEPVFDSHDQLCICLSVMNGTLAGLMVNRDRCAAAVSDPVLLATDLADFLVQEGVAFRDAHHAVGTLVQIAEKAGVSIDKISDKEAIRIHPKLSGDWKSVFNLKKAMERRKGVGMPGPSQIKKQISRWRKRLVVS
jgi:argininosuccinate lyase